MIPIRTYIPNLRGHRPRLHQIIAAKNRSHMDNMPSAHDHLKRLDSVSQKNPIYFITTCVSGRKPLLATSAAHEILVEEWSGMRKRHGWTVGRYVVMPDHVHFFVSPEPSTEKPLNQAVGKWKEWSAKRILRATGQSGSLWQPEFFDHLLRSAESLAEKWNYVRENPVRAGLAKNAADWPYAGSIDFEGY